MATSVLASRKLRWQVPAGVLGVLILGAGAVWWFGPWSKAWRYQRMDLVTLRRKADADPKDFEAWREIGLRLARHGDKLAALPLTQAFALRPSDPYVATALGEVLLASDRIPEAFQVLKAAVAHNPNFPLARMALGRLYQRRSSYLHASEQFEALVAVDRNFPEAWFQLAVCYLQMQQSAKAKAAIEEALRQRPEDPSFLALKGSVDVAVGEVQNGIAATQRAAELAPRNLRIQVNFANMLLAHHRNPEDLQRAAAAIARVEQLDPQYPLLPYMRGELERLRGNWAAAARHLEQAVRATPNQNEVYFALSRTYRRLNRVREADRLLEIYRRRQDLERRIDEIRIALGGRPDDASLYVKLSELQLQLNDRYGAEDSLKTALQIRPGDSALQRRLRQLQGPASAQEAQ
ncbi:MAG: tetratricopeptide repeat protein [Chloroherpetonaceae bacterium]|nr:tetratricopeptide repeat protein [Chthonomonadaceae bacterium]MDW8207800.1 tetratricopeptide repeat protein [Chloroherpetonaceae bacterium]